MPTLRPKRPVAVCDERGKVVAYKSRGTAYQSKAARDANRVLKRIDRAAVKAVSICQNAVDREGVIEAYEGIEAARQIRELFTEIFVTFSRDTTFRRLASTRSK